MRAFTGMKPLLHQLLFGLLALKRACAPCAACLLAATTATASNASALKAQTIASTRALPRSAATPAFLANPMAVAFKFKLEAAANKGGN